VTDGLISALEDLARVVQNAETLGAALANIAEVATESVPRCAAATIALSIEGKPITAAMTARFALELDLVQYDTHDGPCLTAFRTMETLRLNIAEPGEAFPHFARAAADRGVSAVLSVPAKWGDEPVATLNLYSRTGPFDETAVAVGEVLAAQIAIAVSRSPEFATARSVVEHGQRDIDDAADVNIATGLLMVNEGCTAEQAQGLLRSAAVQDEQTIVEIAQRIIRQHGRTR
jgi:GAF domain-containing protein